MPDPASLTGSSCSTTPFAGTDPIADAIDAWLLPYAEDRCLFAVPICRRDTVHLSLTRFNQFHRQLPKCHCAIA